MGLGQNSLQFINNTVLQIKHVYKNIIIKTAQSNYPMEHNSVSPSGQTKPANSKAPPKMKSKPISLGWCNNHSDNDNYNCNHGYSNIDNKKDKKQTAETVPTITKKSIAIEHQVVK